MNRKTETYSFKTILVQGIIIFLLLGIIWFFKTLPEWIFQREMERQLALIPKPAEIPTVPLSKTESMPVAKPVRKPVSPEQIYAALKQIKDPELDINIVDLGLIRNVHSDEKGITVTMILTTPFCPYQTGIVSSVKEAVKKISQQESVSVHMDYSRKWTADDLSEEGRKQWESFFRGKGEK
ncbi:MAG: metal-sulfur cluster assembly factor [Desulfococcaceae bacterium]